VDRVDRRVLARHAGRDARRCSGDPSDTPDYAYMLDVVTYDDQTPDPAATERALLSQKPGGIVLTYRHAPGQDWRSVRENNATWAAVKTRYATWAAVRDDEPT